MFNNVVDLLFAKRRVYIKLEESVFWRIVSADILGCHNDGLPERLVFMKVKIMQILGQPVPVSLFIVCSAPLNC